MNDALVPVLYTVGGAILVKFIERLLPSRDEQIKASAAAKKLEADEAAAQRKEQRDEIAALKAENKVLNDNYDALRVTYREMRDKYIDATKERDRLKINDSTGETTKLNDSDR